MATYYSQGSGDWSTLTNWDTNAGGGGTDPPSVADMDDDWFVIQPGHSIRVDVDTSGFATGVRLTIQGDSGQKGMIYFKDANGWLKIKSGSNIIGSSATDKGRILANSDGVWGNTGAFNASNTAVIELAGTAKIDAQYLDIALYCTQPTNTYVRTYGTKYDFTASGSTVNTTNNTIDLGTTPPSSGTAVMITTSGGSLPGGLSEDVVYYTRVISGNTCKLATRNSDTCIVDITSTGSGTCSVITGHTDTGTATVNVLTDVTGDGQWKTTDGWDRVVLANLYPVATSQSNINQRTQLTTINAGSLVLAANVAMALAPGARIYLASRNVAIRSLGSGSTGPIVDYASATGSSGVFQCEISNTTGTGTTYYGYGVSYGTGHTISGVISGCYRATNSSTSLTFSGIAVGCLTGITGSPVTPTVTGTLAGIYSNAMTFSSAISGSATFSGLVFGSGGAGMDNPQSGSTMSGTIVGVNSYGITSGVGTTISGTIKNCSYGVQGGVNHTITGEIFGCNLGISSCTGTRLTGSIYGCSTAITGGVDLVSLGSSIGYTPTGEVNANVTDIQFPLSIFCRGTLFVSQSFARLNSRAYTTCWGGVFCEDCSVSGRSLGASVWYQGFGTISKQAGTVRVGGNTSALQVDPLSFCSTFSPVLMFEWTEDAVPASATNRSVYIRGFGWSSFPTNSELYVEAEYISNATTLATTVTKSTATISDNSTWVQFTIPEFTPAVTGQVRYRGWLKKYANACGVYVDAQLN